MLEIENKKKKQLNKPQFFKMDKEPLKNLLAEDASEMSEEEIRDAIKMRRLHFGDFEVSPRYSSGGKVRISSNIRDVFFHRSETEAPKRISPKSGWKIEKAAREVFSRLQSPEAAKTPVNG